MSKEPESGSNQVVEAIEEAFLDMYAKLPLEAITVRAVAAHANCSRTTFYRYFKGVDDLLFHLEKQNTCHTVCDRIIQSSKDIPLERASDAIIEFYDDRQPFVQTLIQGSHGEGYLKHQKDTFKPMLSALIDRAFDLTPMQHEYVSEYMAVTKTAMIRLWVEKGCRISLAQVNKMCDCLVETSFWTNIASCRQSQGNVCPTRVYADRHAFEYPWEPSEAGHSTSMSSIKSSFPETM